MSTATDVREMRGEVLRLNAELRTMTRLVNDGNLSLRDFLVLSRALFGADPKLARILADIQLFIALLGTARVMLRAFHVEMGPYGWAILGATTAMGIVMSEIATYEATRGM